MSPLKVVAVRIAEDTAEYLERRAAERRIVLSEYLRRIIDRHVQTTKRYEERRGPASS